MKKLLSIFLAVLMITSIVPITNIEVNAATQVEQILAYAADIAANNPHAYDGYCLAFVGDCYKSAGYSHYSMGDAYTAGTAWIISTNNTDIPVGALVFYDYSWNASYGHVGIYAGNGMMYDAESAYGGVKLRTFKTKGYRGWGWYGGIEPTGVNFPAASEPPTYAYNYQTIASGSYYVKSNGQSTYNYLTVSGTSENSGAAVNAWTFMTASRVQIDNNGGNFYTMKFPEITTANAVNVHTDSTYPTSTTKVTNYKYSGSTTQSWGFDKVSGGYVIRCKANENMVLTCNGSGQATISAYSAGNANQVWSLIPYVSGTVQYNANGGSGAPSSQTKYFNQTLTLSSIIPTRTGYTFLGWSTSSTATSATYFAGSDFNIDANTTLYAIWRENTTTLTLNSSNSALISSGGSSKYFTYTPATSGTYVIYSTSDADTRVYLYDSSGSQLASDDDSGDDFNFRLQYNMIAGTTYRFEIKYYNSSKTGTIPFNFGEVFSISYNANGGTGTLSLQNKDYGKALTLSTTKPTREGYTFLGWSTSSTATSATYSAGSSFTTNTNTTLYAVWKANNYTISYNANGGTDAPSSQTKTHGTSLTLSTTKPTRTGYTFLGWSTSSTATSATYSAGSSFTTNANTTLYAVWKANTYTVSYNANGGTGTPSSQTKTYDECLALSYDQPTRDGYWFAGWATSSSSIIKTFIGC